MAVFIGAVKSKKVNLSNFNINELTARLFTIQRNWSFLPESTRFDQTKAKKWAKEITKNNFIYPKGKLEKVYMNLLLFLLGDKNNEFAKVLNS